MLILVNIGLYCLYRLISVNIKLLNTLVRFNLCLFNTNQSQPIHNYLIWFMQCFFIDFDEKVFIIKVTLKKISFCLKPSKRGCNFVETLENLYFKSWYINNFSKKMR